MSQAVFLTGNLMRHVAVMSFAASVGIIAIFAVDFVDLIFISMLGQSQLAAAVGYAGTLLFFTNAIAIGLSIAAGSLVARSLGADEQEKARAYATSVLFFSFVISIIVAFVTWLNLSAALSLLGAQGQILVFAIGYCQIILPSMFCMGFAMTAMAILRAHGDARSSMLVTLTGSIINACLDPVLIFWAGLELEGAAYASVIARVFMMGYGLWLVWRKWQGFALLSWQLIGQNFRVIFALAIPAMLTNLATPVGMALVTREMARFGTDAVAAMAIVGRLTPLVFAVVLALSGAIGPIVGQNYGAGNFNRVWRTMIDGLIFVALYVLVAFILLYFSRDALGALFDASGEMLALIYLFCGPLALLQFFNGALFICNASFNNMGLPIYSTLLNWGRHTLGTWPFILIGASWAGASGVLIGQAVGGIFFAVVGIFMVWRLIQRLEHSAPDRDMPADMPHRDKRLHQISGQRHW